MVEREFYKDMLREVIEKTEKNKIKSSHEVIQVLIKELKAVSFENDDDSKTIVK